MNHKFWHIHPPIPYHRFAEGDPEQPNDWEQRFCPWCGPTPGRRLMDLSLVLRGRRVEDFTWTIFSECLIQDHVLHYFREQGFTGFEVKPVQARFRKKAAQPPPRLWELVVTGWGGMAAPQSGVRLVSRCQICGRVLYSQPSNPGKLIDARQWDGSDFFIIWPLPRFIFVTDRVARAIQEQRYTGVCFTAPERLDFDPSKELAPGRLSFWMPQARARELGESLGIV